VRYLLSVLALASAGCAFYQPDLPDCVLPCGEAGACPQGLTCLEGLCRPPGKTAACECTAGKSRPCGSNVGSCKQGFQECTSAGTWGECTGSVEPSVERCDGRDNDCDGYTDYVPAKMLVEDRLPYTNYETRLFGNDAGYSLLVDATLGDGGIAVLLRHYDDHFNELGAPTVVREGDFSRSFAATTGEAVVTALNVEGTVELHLTPMQPGATSLRLAELPDSGYERRIHVAVMPGFARIGWGTGTSVRLADVPWDGGVVRFRDLPDFVDGGSVVDFSLTSDGRSSLFQVPVDEGDGGVRYLNVLQDNETFVIARTDVGLTFAGGYDYPFVRGRQPLLARGNELPYVSDWSDGLSRRVTFSYDLATSDDSYEVLPQGEGTWGESDVVLAPNQDLLAAFSNSKQQSIVLTSIHGSAFRDLEIVQRNLPDNSGFGPPSIALSGDEMVGLVWTTSRGVMARRVCPPRVGD
jgi:hypothetical protein